MQSLLVNTDTYLITHKKLIPINRLTYSINTRRKNTIYYK